MHEHDDSMADRVAIEATIGMLAAITDTRPVVELTSVYADDVEWSLADVSITGVDAMIARCRLLRAEAQSGPGTFTRHVVKPMEITFKTEDQAQAISYFTLVRNISTNPVTAVAGVYVDTLTRTTDGWRISTRIVTMTPTAT